MNHPYRLTPPIITARVLAVPSRFSMAQGQRDASWRQHEKPIGRRPCGHSDFAPFFLTTTTPGGQVLQPKTSLL